MGIVEDTDLKGQQYAWLTTAGWSLHSPIGNQILTLLLTR